MAVITFDQIRERMARHAVEEAARTAPAAVACAALDDIRESLALMAGSERREILDELAALLDDASEPAAVTA